MIKSKLALPVICILILGLNAYAHESNDGTGGHHGEGGGAHGEEMHGFGDHHVEHNLVLPQVVVGGSSTTTLMLFNMGNRQEMPWTDDSDLETSGILHFFGQDGSPLVVKVDGQDPSSEHTFSLSANHSLTLKLTGEGELVQGWALVEVEDDDLEDSAWGNMDGREVRRGERLVATAFYTLRDQQSKVIYQVGVVPAIYEMGHFFSSIMAAQFSTEVNTGVGIVNSSAEAVTVTLRLKDASGNLVATEELPLQAGQQTAAFITDIFVGKVPQGFQGVLEVTTQDEGVVTLGLLMTENILTSIPIHHHGSWSQGGMGGGMMP